METALGPLAKEELDAGTLEFDKPPPVVEDEEEEEKVDASILTSGVGARPPLAPSVLPPLTICLTFDQICSRWPITDGASRNTKSKNEAVCFDVEDDNDDNDEAACCHRSAATAARRSRDSNASCGGVKGTGAESPTADVAHAVDAPKSSSAEYFFKLI